MRVQYEKSHADDGKQRQQFRRGEEVADLRSGAHAAHVDECQHADQNSKNERAGQRIGRMRPEFAEINHKQIRIGRGRRHLPEQSIHAI